MRIVVLAVVSLLLLTMLTAAPAAAIPPVCVTKTVGGTPVSVEVGYGGGVGCLQATVSVCTLRSDPENPSHPWWTCRAVVSLP